MRKAIELDPDYACAYYNWGMLCSNLDDTIRGRRPPIQKAIELNPDYVSAYGLAGILDVGERSAIENKGH